MKDVFESIICKQQKIIKKNKGRFNITGYLKLLLFIMFAVAICFMFAKKDNTIFIIATIVLLLIQIVAWIYHIRLGNRIEHATGMVEINRRHVARLAGQWDEFTDTGEEFIEPEHPYGGDLDIVGKKSLFQFINTTHTWHGRHAFADDLLHATYSKEQIKQRQEVIAELANDNDFTSELEYSFSKIGIDAASQLLLEELKDDFPFMKNRTLRMVLTYAPLFVTCLVGLTVIFKLR